MDDVHSFQAEFVGRPDDARLHAAACEGHRHGVRVVATAGRMDAPAFVDTVLADLVKIEWAADEKLEAVSWPFFSFDSVLCSSESFGFHFGSKVSMWPSPLSMKSMITFFTRTRNIVFFIASG
jgi:hypothetical protein